MLMIGGLYCYISKVMGVEIEMHMMTDIISVMMLSFIWMAVPSLISLFIFQRYDIAEALRND